MPLDMLADTIRAFLSPDFTGTDRRDIREFAIHELGCHGVTADHFATLDQLAALCDVLAKELATRKAA